MRQSLELVRYLTLEGPIFRKSRQMLRNMCLPGEALFLGVTQLCLCEAEHPCTWPFGTEDIHKDLYPQPIRDVDFVLFERPDLCVKDGPGSDLLAGFPSPKYGYSNVSFPGCGG